jgi:hypothetical protein
MNRTSRFSAALLAAAMAMPAAGWAQTAVGPTAPVPAQAQPGQAQPGQGAGTPANPPHAAPPMGHSPQAASLMQGVEQHIRDLHRELHITAAEQPQWDQFAAVMRSNAQAMSESLDQRAQQVGAMTAVDSMTSYAQLAEQRSEDLGKLATAFQALYATFPDQQKKDADALFRRQSEAHAEKRAEKHAG